MSASVTSITEAGSAVLIFSLNGSMLLETRKNTSAALIAAAPEGFNANVWGEAEPSTIRLGWPTPSMIAAANAWIGFDVTTTLRSLASAGWASVVAARSAA